MFAQIQVTHSAERGHKMGPKLTGLYPVMGRVFFTLPFFLGTPLQYNISQTSPHWQIELFHVAKIGLLLLSVCVLSGLKSRGSAVIITVILIALSLTSPSFRAFEDPMARQLQQRQLLQNAILLGGAMMIGYFGSGPYSLDRQLAKWVGAWLDSFFKVRYSDIIEWRTKR